MTMMTLDDIGAVLMEEAEAATLRQLATIALRHMRAEAEAILDAGIARLEAGMRLVAEAGRVRAMMMAATPPEAMEVAPVAPARGAMQLVADYALLPGGARRLDGHHWRGVDPLSAMCRRAYARYADRTPVDAKGAPLPFVAPFSPGQIAMAQHYQALVERHDAAGMKCASVEVRNAASAGGQGGGGFIEAYLSEGREIDAIRRRIGDGLALEVRRGGNPARRNITARRLVDMVVLGGMDLTAVLRAHGWNLDGPSRKAARAALADVLDRMQGYPKKGA